MFLAVLLLNTEDSDSLLVYRFCEAAKANIDDYDKATSYLEKASSIAYETKCDGCIAESEYTYGVMYLQHSIYDSSIFHLNICIKQIQK